MPTARTVRSRRHLSRVFQVESLEVRRLLSSIQGTVFSDGNANGVQDNGETGPGLGTQLVFLDQNDDGVVDNGELSTSVDGFGTYFFNNLKAGTYRVRLMQDQFLIRDTPAADSANVSLGAGVNAIGPTFGVEGSKAIDGTTYNDANHNGTRDSSEPVLPNTIVYLDQNNNGTPDAATTSFSSSDIPKTAAGLTTVASNLNVSGLSGLVTDVNVTVNISSPDANDPDVFLENPQGVRVELVSVVDTASQDTHSNFTNTFFDDQATRPISAGVTPFTGSFQTSGFARGFGLSNFNFLSGNGTWRLIVEDTATNNTARLNSWSMQITSGDPSYQTDGSGIYFMQPWPGKYTVRASHPGFVVTEPSTANGQKYSADLVTLDFAQDKDFGLRELNTVKQTVTFAGAVNPAHLTEDSPFGIVQGDYNKDGKTDLATVNNGSNDVSIYRGKGNGTFNNPVFYPVGMAPRGIAEADLNGDGNMDMVVTNHDNSTISVLLGNANGTLKSQVTYAAGNSPWTVALADVTGDGKLDAIVGSNGIKNVTIVPGNGNGTFDAAHPISLPDGFYPMGVRTADMNGDGKQDIVTSNSNDGTVGVLINKGGGAFNPVKTTPVGSSPAALNVVDLNGDKKIDVIVANASDRTIDVLLGKGDGTFQAAVPYTAGDTPAAVNLGDLNGDGKADIIVSSRSDGGTELSGDVRVYLSNGDGTLQNPFIYTAHKSPVWAAVGDFNGDTKPDLAVANFFSDDVSILLNTTASFTQTTTDPATITLQAESATLAGGAATSTANSGFTGSGYADYGGSGSSVQWTTSRAAAGAVTLVFRYANGSTASRPLSVVVNGASLGTIACAPTGSWTTWSTVSLNASLQVGSNTIKATASTSVGGANVDSLTINTGTTTPSTTYQAESATLAGGTVVASANSGFTGSGYADFGSTNSSVTFAVSRTSAGAATLSFRYANGSTANRSLSVSVNGTVVSSPTFAPTGSWTAWATITLSVNLLTGSNSIKLSVTGADGPNLDSLTVS